MACASGVTPAALHGALHYVAHCSARTPGHAENATDVPCDWIASGGKDACHPSDIGYGKLAEAVEAAIAAP